MGYQFTNNWPYTYTLFPTMVDHVDPANHDYYAGLMTEIENIEDELGLNPSGDYASVKDAILASGLPANWEIVQIDKVIGTADLTQTAISFGDMTDITISMTTGANYILILSNVCFWAWAEAGEDDLGGMIRLMDGGTRLLGGIFRVNNKADMDGIHGSVPHVYFGTVTAAAHTFHLEWRALNSNNALRMYANSVPDQYHATLTVIELKKKA